MVNVHARDVGVVSSRTLPCGMTAPDRNRLAIHKNEPVEMQGQLARCTH